MKYARIKFNDVANSPGIAVSFYTQGCPHHCYGCFNPETWDFMGGEEFTVETLHSILEGLHANGINRSLCILGGEPLCQENVFLTKLLITEVKKHSPDTKIYIWTGYLYEDLLKTADTSLMNILSSADYLIDGPFKLEERDITLRMRGSRNQRIINLQTGEDVTHEFDSAI